MTGINISEREKIEIPHTKKLHFMWVVSGTRHIRKLALLVTVGAIKKEKNSSTQIGSHHQ